MSLLEFPPLNSSGKPYAIQEFNGRILSGSLVEFQAMAKKKDGVVGVIDYVADLTENSKLWPVARLTYSLLLIFSIIQSSKLLYINGIIFRKSNWLRCVAVHDEGRRLAICQNNDYIRVYSIGRPQRAPFTLKHPLQMNVTCMAWEPFDQRVLAVAVSDKILIWRLNTKGANINQIIWDRTTTNAILATSPNSGKIMLCFEVIKFHIVDVSTGEVDSFGAWTGGNITNVVSTADGRRLVVLYTGNIIRVYDRSTWREERWSGLAGRAVSAVWSPTGCCLLFSSENSHQIYSIAFSAKNEVSEDGIFEARWIGDTHAVPVFDLSPVEFDPSEVEIEGAVEREIVTIGGKVHCMTLSPDGQRYHRHILDNPGVVAIFIVDWLPTVRLTPAGFVEAPMFGCSSIIFFLPKFSSGSMLTIVWSDGCIQYFPLIYGPKSSFNFNSRTILDEISDRSSPDKVCDVYNAKSLREHNIFLSGSITLRQSEYVRAYI
uniref:WD_REPEATS_REGION domain-containing protein n=1 Tax=Angiostrongylus cantonensis TaxID=6313 RepID=A0A0K0D0I9_ANGCA